jgi:hypothetical protein
MLTAAPNPLDPPWSPSVLPLHQDRVSSHISRGALPSSMACVRRRSHSRSSWSWPRPTRGAAGAARRSAHGVRYRLRGVHGGLEKGTPYRCRWSPPPRQRGPRLGPAFTKGRFRSGLHERAFRCTPGGGPKPLIYHAPHVFPPFPWSHGCHILPAPWSSSVLSQSRSILRSTLVGHKASPCWRISVPPGERNSISVLSMPPPARGGTQVPLRKPGFRWALLRLSVCASVAGRRVPKVAIAGDGEPCAPNS